MLPPRIVRRLVVAPAAFLGGLVILVMSPLLGLVALLVDLARRWRWKSVRFVALLVVFAAYESLGLLALFVAWTLTGFGVAIRSPPSIRLHVWLERRWLAGITWIIRTALGIRIDYLPQPRAKGPVLVFSRHGGPGDSVFLTHALLVDFGRHPRIVAKRELQWAPFLDVLGNRLPNHFVDRHPQDRARELEAIERLAKGIEDRGALVLFPEGGNFTVWRRDRVISRFEAEGDHRRASWAKSMPNLIAPRPGGALAAMRGAPDAEVVFVAHTGLEDLVSLADIWRSTPLNRKLVATYWRTTPEERPEDAEAQVAWLFRWWASIDRWIEENRPASVVPAPRL